MLSVPGASAKSGRVDTGATARGGGSRERLGSTPDGSGRACGRRRPYQSRSAAPHVKPEPKETQATFMPRFSRPSASASAMSRGIVAAVVFP